MPSDYQQCQILGVIRDRLYSRGFGCYVTSVWDNPLLVVIPLSVRACVNVSSGSVWVGCTRYSIEDVRFDLSDPNLFDNAVSYVIDLLKRFYDIRPYDEDALALAREMYTQAALAKHPQDKPP